MNVDLILDKIKQMFEYCAQRPLIGFIVGGILIFISSGGDGQVESGKGFLLILGCAIILFSLGAFGMFRIWG